MASEVLTANTYCCLAIIGPLVAIAVGWYFFSIYNSLIFLRNQIDKAWANIDVLLKQRSDLIPNLVNSVKGYMKYEREVLTEITALRASIISATGLKEKAMVNERISAALKSIFAVAENYPKLRASENFLKLQEQLTAIENQIADRREFYNDSVLLYNTRIKTFPYLLVAILLGMKEKEYFKVTEEEKKEVNVAFEEK